MGQLITTVAGGFLGSMIGGPFGAQVGMMLGGMVGATLFGPTIKGPRLNDLKVSASTYGVAIPEIYGTVRLGGNIIWTSGIKETKNKSRAGKGGPKQVNYTYDATFAVALCKGVIDDVLRIWADGKLIYDSTNNATRAMSQSTPSTAPWVGTTTSAKKKKGIKFRVYRGDENQLPDSLIVADKGTDSVSAHRGIAYVVFEKMQLEDYGNRIPQLTFEITKKIVSTFPSLIVTENGQSSMQSIYGSWIPDWELGRIVHFENDATTIFDLNTLQSHAKGPALKQGGTYIPSVGMYLTEIDTSNSRRLEMTSLLSFSHEGYIGKPGPSIDGVYIEDGNIYEQYGALRKVAMSRVMRGNGERQIILMITNGGSAWCIGAAEKIPIFNAHTNLAPTGIIALGMSSSAKFVSWRCDAGTVKFDFWTIGGGAQGTNYTLANGKLAWQPSQDWERQRVEFDPFPGQAYSASLMLYDPSDNSLFSAGVIAGRLATFKYSIDSGLIKFATRHPDILPPPSEMQYSRLNGGTFGYARTQYMADGRFIQIDLQTGALVQSALIDSTFGLQHYMGGNQHWDDVSSTAVLGTSSGYRRIAFRMGSGYTGVASVVRDICLRTGVLTDDDLDVSGMNTGNLVGYLIDRETTARDILKQLGTAFLFDGYESDYKLKFKSRGGAVVTTIPENWIGRSNEGVVVKETLTQELEMPLRVTVNYYDTSRDHQQGSQSAKRKAGPVPTMWTRKEDIIDLPITWTPDDAKQCADKLLKMSWANRNSFEMSLPWRYLKYDPTDVVGVTLNDGTVYTVRLGEVTAGADFVVEARGVSEKATAYQSNAKGTISITPPQVISYNYPCFPLIVNTPLLRDIDYNTSGNSICYLSVGTDALEFGGAAVEMGNGIEFRPVGFIDNETTTGYCLTTLPKVTHYESTDEQTELFVRLADYEHTLSSVTQEEMLAGANAALIGEEIIYFRDVELQENGTWKITGILRARRGTNYAVGSHKANERFLLLEENAVTAFARSSDSYFIDREFKAVPSGTLTEDATGYTRSLVPRDLMPYTPENVTISDDGTTVTMTASRRSRITAPLQSGTGFIPYKEGEKASARIKYEVWPDLTLADVETTTLASISGEVVLFDAFGNDIATVFSFPLSALNGSNRFLIKLYETGFVDGTPKWIEYNRIDLNRWDFTELY